MNGIESLLLIIIGVIVIGLSFYIAEEEIPQGWEHKIFLLICAYGWVAFIAGNIMFFVWLSNN